MAELSDNQDCQYVSVPTADLENFLSSDEYKSGGWKMKTAAHLYVATDGDYGRQGHAVVFERPCPSE